jgi:hypothetical protein
MRSLLWSDDKSAYHPKEIILIVSLSIKVAFAEGNGAPWKTCNFLRKRVKKPGLFAIID